MSALHTCMYRCDLRGSARRLLALLRTNELELNSCKCNGGCNFSVLIV